MGAALHYLCEKVSELPVALLDKLATARRYALAIASLSLAVSPGAWAQPYPARAVRIIVPYAPGANADLIARIVAQRVAAVWGQQVILDNRPGGATNIGSVLAAKSLMLVRGSGPGN